MGKKIKVHPDNLLLYYCLTGDVRGYEIIMERITQRLEECGWIKPLPRKRRK